MPDDGDITRGRLLARAKSNIGPDTGGFGYDLEQVELKSHPGIFASRVLWGAAIDGTARELLAQADANDNPEEQGAIADAKKFLMETLTEGALSSKQIFAEARDAGHSERTIKRAKKELAVEAFKPDMKTGWKWRMPTKEAKNTEEGQQNNVDPFAKVGPLRRADSGSSAGYSDAEVFE